MNLAIHDFTLLRRLHEAGETRSWHDRNVVAWTTSAQGLGRPHLLQLTESVPLLMKDLLLEERGFFGLCRERFRRLTHREAVLFFLTEQTGSVLLTEEPMVAEAARALGLRVCSGSATAIDSYFPLPIDSNSTVFSTSVAESSAVSTAAIVEDLREHFAPSAIPSSRRVPDGDEPVATATAMAARGSTGPVLAERTTQRNLTRK